MRTLVVLSLLFTALAFAETPFKSFVGSYYISSAPIHDPMKPLPVDTHLYINVEGEAAKNAYNAMKVKPAKNICGEDHLSKDAGDFTCSFYPKTKKYFCSFSVDINKGKLDSGGYC